MKIDIKKVLLENEELKRQCTRYEAMINATSDQNYVVDSKIECGNKRIEQELQHGHEKLRVLAESAGSLLSNEKPDQIIQTIAINVMKNLHCDFFVNYILDEHQGRLRLNAYHGVSAEVAKEIEWLDLGMAICGSVARDGCRIVSENIPTNGDERAELARSFGIKAYACHPLRLGEQIIGTLSFGTRTRIGFTDDELEMMRMVADQISIAKQRKQVEDKLRESEERLRAVLENSLDAVYRRNIQTDRYDYMSPVIEQILGFTPEEMNLMNIDEILERVHPEDLPGLSDAIESANLTGRGCFEYRFRRKDGSYCWLADYVKVIMNDLNQPLYRLGIARDCTERKQTEEALRESQAKLETALTSMNDAVIISDPEGRLIHFNEAFATFHRFRNKDECSKTFADYPDILDVFFPDGTLAPIEMWAVSRALRGETAIDAEYTLKRKDTGETWVGSYSFSPVRDHHNKIIGSVVVGRDITERKRTEEVLHSKQAELTAANSELHSQEAELTALNEQLRAQQEELYATYQDLQSQAEATAKARDDAEKRAMELDATISSIAAGVVIYDNTGNIVRINEIARSLLGYTSSGEIDDLSFQKQMTKTLLCKTDGTPYTMEEAPLFRALRGEVIPDEELLVIKEVEKPVWISSTFAPIYEKTDNLIGVILIFTDITEQKRKTEDLLASERELLKVTLNSLVEGVVTIDQDGSIIFINEAASKISGYSQNDAIGKPVTKILRILDDKSSEPIGNIASLPFVNSSVLVTQDLKEVIISINSAPIRSADGRSIGTVIVFQDITEKQQIEQELLKAAKLDSLGILAGGVAHDFNNILAGILANLQLAVIKLKKNQDISKYLDDTIKISRRASDLTKQLLTFAKGGDPVKKAASIAKIVKETVQFALSGSKIKAEFYFAEGLWAVEIDEGQITQVINNLTINAEQAMYTGGIIEIYGENVTIETIGQHHPGRYVKLTIKDQGMGISTEIINKIFDPFFTTKKTGNGLGLSTSYSIIKKHHGYLEVESSPGMGTIFYIYLPASIEELSIKESKMELVTSGEARILLMDDEDTIRNIGGEMLSCFGYRVTLARNGQEAVDIYQHAMKVGEPFDAVIMDLTVPGGLGGIETISILRRIDPEINAIISSGYASDPVMSDYERYGFRGVVIKPYKIDELNAVINQVIERKQLLLDFPL